MLLRLLNHSAFDSVARHSRYLGGGLPPDVSCHDHRVPGPLFLADGTDNLLKRVCLAILLHMHHQLLIQRLLDFFVQVILASECLAEVLDAVCLPDYDGLGTKNVSVK